MRFSFCSHCIHINHFIGLQTSGTLCNTSVHGYSRTSCNRKSTLVWWTEKDSFSVDRRHAHSFSYVQVVRRRIHTRPAQSRDSQGIFCMFVVSCVYPVPNCNFRTESDRKFKSNQGLKWLRNGVGMVSSLPFPFLSVPFPSLPSLPAVPSLPSVPLHSLRSNPP